MCGSASPRVDRAGEGGRNEQSCENNGDAEGGSVNNDAKVTCDVILAAKAMAEDLRLGLVSEEQLRYTIVAREDRKAIANELKAKGVPTAKIAELTGTNQRTI